MTTADKCPKCEGFGRVGFEIGKVIKICPDCHGSGEKQAEPKPDVKCEFDTAEGCKALACYSGQKCNSRDKDGNPMYYVKPEVKTGEGLSDEENKLVEEAYFDCVMSNGNLDNINAIIESIIKVRVSRAKQSIIAEAIKEINKFDFAKIIRIGQGYACSDPEELTARDIKSEVKQILERIGGLK